MSLNPVQFSKTVIDQFGRYLLTTFPLADERLAAQVKDALRHRVDGEALLYRGPYVYLNQPFEPGPTLDALLADSTLRLHPALKGIFPFESLHKHQELALRAIKAGQHIVVATGTGSGKTESFLLPIIDDCLHQRDSQKTIGITAILVYPMNALVNDQLDRLRFLLAGTRITFGRYTGETPEKAGDSLTHLTHPRPYTDAEQRAYLESEAHFGEEALPLPWEECYDRVAILERRPRILLTNYSQLEYLLLRDKDLSLFRGAPLRFVVFDEVHTYTGELGSEVACLIRRLREVTRKSPADVICIGTSATVSERPTVMADTPAIDAEMATRNFAHRLFGVPPGDIAIITERFKPMIAPPDIYTPTPPPDPQGLLHQILEAARMVHQREEPGDIPPELVSGVEILCGRTVPAATVGMARLYGLLRSNALIYALGQIFSRPVSWEQAFPRLRALTGRAETPDEDLIAECLAYLTVGAIAVQDGEPLLRPKLHIFIQGLQGLFVAFETSGPKVFFDTDVAQRQTERQVFPLYLCRACGQHYLRLFAGDHLAVQSGDRVSGYQPVRIPERYEDPGEGVVHLTDTLWTEDEKRETNRETVFLCPYCGALHHGSEDTCLNPKCRHPGRLMPFVFFEGNLTTCPACGAVARGRLPTIRETFSSEVVDIAILSQSMLAAMEEPAMQKVLIFADNRQDAAFQAGWMQERSKRFRLRHLLYRTLNGQPGKVWSFDRLTDELLSLAETEKIVPLKEWDDDDERTRLNWFLLEEFASTAQRRSSLEQLGLARVHYAGLRPEADPDFFNRWAATFAISPDEVASLVNALLDYYRRRGLLSDPLLTRFWSYQDIEFRRGIIITADYYRPKALVFEKGQDSPFVMSWRAANGRAGAQAIVEKAVSAERLKSLRDRFLEDLWTWLKNQEYLVPVQLVQRRQGKLQAINLGGETLHVNIAKLGISEADTRFVCEKCQRAQSMTLPTGRCPEYNCKGQTAQTGRDEENYDVVQYTRLSFVPMKVYEHSAQVPKGRREWVEREFKKADGALNTIVATPTLELGVDIGKLEMTMMRNVPPTPANYAQRSGRAGRRHRIAVVFTYCRTHPHDRYFFAEPPEMIAGSIRVPAFSMQNEPLIRKHIHSAVLTALRELAAGGEKNALEQAFPTYIWAYFGEKITDAAGAERMRYFDSSPKFDLLTELIQQHRPQLLKSLESAFAQTWPVEDAHAVTPEILGRYADEMAAKLEAHARRLFLQVRTYNNILRDFRRREDSGVSLTNEERHRRRQFEYAREALEKSTLENYSLSYLANDGFFPGYSLGRESVAATSFDPLLEISRPAAVALRELTPANQVYANKNVFRVQTLNFYKLKAEDANFTPDLLLRRMRFNAQTGYLFDPVTESRVDSSSVGEEITSFQLTDVELDQLQEIDDRQDTRRRMAFDIYGLLMGTHAGGHQGRINAVTYRFLRKAAVRLVNLGPSRVGPASPGRGFPICPQCGETRSPLASPEEINRFAEAHRERCRTDILWTAIHVEIPSDVLVLGPYTEVAEVANVMESLRIGARMVLDMGETEIEGFTMADEAGAYWVCLYDPMPGGSGFLPQILNYWPAVCQQARRVLNTCTCPSACYKCMRHFRNQQFHEQLDRHVSMTLLGALEAYPTREHEIAPVVARERQVEYHPESDAEADFPVILDRRNFPLPPVSQFRVDLGSGSFTVADYAYPEQKVLIFIDGMSQRLHGNPAQQRKDKLQRAKARMLGYQVIELTAETIHDDIALSGVLEELAVYLGHEGTNI